MFDADRPITKSDQDKLNRSSFAKYLARCLLNQAEPDSLVVGLFGAAGSGKTSLINLIVEEITEAAQHSLESEKPIVLNFSAWSYSGQHRLTYNFFRRLSSTLRQASYLEEADRIIELLELYVSFFTHQSIPQSLQPKRSLLQILTGRGRDSQYAWESGKDLTSIKSQLNELLRQQKHKIIIIIDNISHLYPDEIRQMFQIVKSMGDYANTAYLLAFDKEQVVYSLNRLEGHYAKALVEKVIQLPFEVPPILSQEMENIFSDRLKPVLHLLPLNSWDREYWADIYYTSLKYFFKNCRDITRYVNILQFSYGRLKEVVNPVDFFALTAIEVFLPNVYEGIRDNKDLFTDLIDNVYSLNENLINKEKMRCDEIIERAKNFSFPILRQLLMHLFPRLHHIYEPTIAFYHSDTLARKLKRICSPDLFEIYFCFSLQSSYISESEFNTILALAKDRVAFDQALARLNKDEKITKFLDLLDVQLIEKISLTETNNIIYALLDNGDLFPAGNSHFLKLDTATHIHRIIHSLLQKIDDKTERFKIMQHAIADATKSIYMIVHELKAQQREHQEDEEAYLPIAYRDFLPTQLTALQALCIEKIKMWGKNDRLAEHPQLLTILYAWSAWDTEKTYQIFVKEMTKTDRGLLQFLTAFLATPIVEAMTKNEKKPSWGKYVDMMGDFINPTSLCAHAKILFEDNYFEKLREKEQLAIMIFLDLVKVETEKIIPKTTV